MPRKGRDVPLPLTPATGASRSGARRVIGGAFGALGQGAVRLLDLPARMLDTAALLRRAGGAAPLAPHDAEAPLGVLLEDYRRHARLSLAGCFAARFDIARLLGNLGAPAAREACEPAILAAPVERPIIITGMPRSGTTFLHRLLAEDPENRSPAVWETVYPLPRRADDPPARRIATVRRQLAAFARMAPGFAAVHPIDGVAPQECTEITAHAFRSFRFETTHHVPGYRTWLRAADHVPAYRFHRRFLQHLQHTDGGARRWVLKCPDHVFTLAALEALCERFGLALERGARRRMAVRIRELPRSGCGGVTHHLSEYGIDAAAARPRFAGSVRRSGVGG